MDGQRESAAELRRLTRKRAPNARAAREKVPFLVSPHLAQFGDRLRTDALTVREWTEYFGRCSTKRMRTILRGMSAVGDAWQLGTAWQIRLIDAPARYLIDVGLLAPVVSRKLAIELVDALELGRFGKN